MDDIKELYKKAGELHGHYCPGLAIGVRAAAEACRILETGGKKRDVYCIAESKACYIDGIQVVFGTTWGNGGLELRDRGKTAFDFYDRESGKSVRLCAVKWPSGMEKEAMIDFILTAPLEQVFKAGDVHFDLPDGAFKKLGKAVCSVCGEECSENFLRIKNGAVVCLDCFEKE